MKYYPNLRKKETNNFNIFRIYMLGTQNIIIVYYNEKTIVNISDMTSLFIYLRTSSIIVLKWVCGVGVFSTCGLYILRRIRKVLFFPSPKCVLIYLPFIYIYLFYISTFLFGLFHVCSTETQLCRPFVYMMRAAADIQ